MSPSFIPGRKLCEEFFAQAVFPILNRKFPDLRYSAALIDEGSEVLGFDDAVSTDHHWGPRVQVFIREEAIPDAEKIKQTLAVELPHEFMGYSTNFSAPDPKDAGVQQLKPVTNGLVNHRVSVGSIRQFLIGHLGFDILHPLTPADWLSFPEQRLNTVSSGPIFYDKTDLRQVCSKFSYYPHDVWLYQMACCWARIGQEEHLMGRAGSVGDEIGSAIIGSRLVRDIMRLCFMQEKKYAPYPKWFGTAFNQLSCSAELVPHLQGALAARKWQEREEYLVKAYEFVALKHNQLRLTDPLPDQTNYFFGRPFKVIAQHGFSSALIEKINDPVVRQIAAKPPIGGLDLVSDNTDLLSNTCWRDQIRDLYD